METPPSQRHCSGGQLFEAFDPHPYCSSCRACSLDLEQPCDICCAWQPTPAGDSPRPRGRAGKTLPEASSKSRFGTTQSSLGGGSVLDLHSVAHGLWRTSVAPKTKTAYETSFRTYISFLLLQGVVAV
ncbi:uncharacterized protein LOC110450866 isoform X2 [Mizuhopecten yessoensis]|uniref:uncharacterized protein LOC110450866 isoform X2 n=1 Tax=Mizuhopecten yessoensis TaxID=6573 RepID=UPI000B45F4D5|nr:uncharacterized protein LOC110450866 isoform X2 [Mizuhopecten yessoensis]